MEMYLDSMREVRRAMLLSIVGSKPPFSLPEYYLLGISTRCREDECNARTKRMGNQGVRRLGEK